MNRRQFLAAFPAFAALPFGCRALSPWVGDKLVVCFPGVQIDNGWRSRLMEYVGTVNAAEFHGEPAESVLFSSCYVSAVRRDGHRDVELTFRRWVNSTIAGFPVYQSSDFRKLS